VYPAADAVKAGLDQEDNIMETIAKPALYCPPAGPPATAEPHGLPRLTELLDAVRSRLLAGHVDPAMEQLFSGLRRYRLACTSEQWEPVVEACLAHPLRELIHQDPITRRCFDKPRGYAGDAPLLDLLYGIAVNEEPLPTGSPASGIFTYCFSEPAARAVRFRRELLARTIDEAARRVHRPRIFSVAAGHLREAELAESVREGRVDFLALEQDSLSVEEVNRCYGSRGVQGWRSSIRPLLTGEHNRGPFDLIYAAGLYDYLSDPITRRLTRNLFGLLAPGGRLLVANFLPAVHAVGFMESYMAWRLIMRSHEQFANVAAEVPADQVARTELFTDPDDNIVFLTLDRR
jgi:hypothetical protein